MKWTYLWLIFSEPVCKISLFHYSTYNSVITAISYHRSQKSLGKVAAAAAAIPDTAMEDPLQIKVMPKREEMGRENSFPSVTSIKTQFGCSIIGDYSTRTQHQDIYTATWCHFPTGWILPFHQAPNGNAGAAAQQEQKRWHRWVNDFRHLPATPGEGGWSQSQLLQLHRICSQKGDRSQWCCWASTQEAQVGALGIMDQNDIQHPWLIWYSTKNPGPEQEFHFDIQRTWYLFWHIIASWIKITLSH